MVLPESDKSFDFSGDGYPFGMGTLSPQGDGCPRLGSKVCLARFLNRKPGEIMALRLEDKKALVAEVNAVAGDSVTAVAAEYRGLSVSEMTELRKNARNAGVYMRVVKNTLARRAVEGTEFECMQDTLKGPILLAFAKEDPGAAARVIKDFAKEHDALKAVSLSAGGQVMPGSDLAMLADLPTLDQARAMLLGVLNAPMSKLVRTLAEPPAMLARTLSARGEQTA
jgi:large subunit ribosomal protein L10